MDKHIIFVVFAALMVATTGSARAEADESLVCAVAATVNDEVITTYELDQRVNLLVNTSGVNVSGDDLEELRRQILNGLIDEKLQLQEFKRFDQTVARADVERYLGGMAAQNGLSLEAFFQGLRDIDVDPETLVHQIEAEIAWMELVNGLFGDRAEVDDQEVEMEMSRVKKSMSETRYLLSEIYLDAPDPQERARVAANARRIFDQIRGGAAFAAMARQFSSQPSAARGGDIDWVSADAMPEEVGAALREAQSGVVLPPIETTTGYYVIAVRDVRHSMDVMNTDAIVNAVQMVYSLPPDAAQNEIESARTRLERVSLNGDVCRAALDYAENDADVIAVPLEGIALSDMRDVFRAALAPLKVGEASPALRAAGGVHRLVLCEREDIAMEEEVMSMPSKDEITRQLEDRRLSLFAQRYLRDLRRDANIEILL